MARVHLLPPTNDAHNEGERIRIALRQLERSEDYLVAVINLELEDPEARRALHELRGGVLALRAHLAKPRGAR